MDKVNAGVIGTGFIGPAHIEALRRLGYVYIAALCDMNKELAEAKAKQLRVEKAYSDYKELISDPDIQCVHICTPNHLHYDIARAAIKAGKHVVCEKPLAMNSSQAMELADLAQKRGVVNAVNFNVRFYPVIHHMKAMIEKGELGSIFEVSGAYRQDWLLYESDYSWRLEAGQSGASRAVADIGSHWMDTAEFVTGEKIGGVCADFAIFHKTRKKPKKPAETYSNKAPEDYEEVPIHTEDFAAVLMRFKSGARGSFTVNQAAAGRKNSMRIEIYGSRASVYFDSERPNELWIGKRDTPNCMMLKDAALVYPDAGEIIGYPGGHTEGFADTFKQCFGKIYTCILQGAKRPLSTPFPTFNDGVRELMLCEAIGKSAQERRWVEEIMDW